MFDVIRRDRSNDDVTLRTRIPNSINPEGFALRVSQSNDLHVLGKPALQMLLLQNPIFVEPLHERALNLLVLPNSAL